MNDNKDKTEPSEQVTEKTTVTHEETAPVEQPQTDTTTVTHERLA